MGNKALVFIRNFSYAISSNLVSLIVSILVILIIPKILGVKDYGYLQLYLFYSSYVGFLHFGWNDGIYLRYGGKEYKDLDKKLFFSQFYMLLLFQTLIVLFIFSFSEIFIENADRKFIFQMTAFGLLITNVSLMLSFILQVTNKIKEYAQNTLIGRILYFSFIIIFIFIGVKDYKLIIVADLIGKLISFMLAVYYCRDIVFRKISTFYFSLKETIENINVGIRLMFANIASMLIIGVVRFGVERSWDISTFGKVSLTLNISNFVMIFINTIGIIIYPVLRRTSEKRLPDIYVTIRDFLMVILLAILIAYFPLNAILSTWLPKYTDSLHYMALLLPMCIYEGKTALLTNTYLKTLRKEIVMLKINIISLLLSVVSTLFTTILLQNLNLAIASIVFLLVIRSILTELYLSRLLGISIYKDVLLESIMTIYFILTAWYINSWLTVIVYIVAYLIYLAFKKKDIINMTKRIRSLIKS
ncbi:MAG TPA: oligosaccharide flippase family protein [Bacillus sp. (in: firmicutes)]|nr:oligosaccharide flippase family protein [Bacillus sp. (in: firmicutes)]